MSYYNQQPPVGAPPPQGYPPQQGYYPYPPQPVYAQPPPQQDSGPSFLEGCLAALCCVWCLDSCCCCCF